MTILQITADGIDAIENNASITAILDTHQLQHLFLETQTILQMPIEPKTLSQGQKSTNHRDQLARAIERIRKAITGRRGQEAFRENLIITYGRCLVTGCQVIALLEAAHIQPYSKRGIFDVSNGLLLRADIHTLFDLGFIAVNESTKRIIIHPTLAESEYGVYQDKPLRLTPQNQTIPDVQALATHRQRVGL